MLSLKHLMLPNFRTVTSNKLLYFTSNLPTLIQTRYLAAKYSANNVTFMKILTITLAEVMLNNPHEPLNVNH